MKTLSQKSCPQKHKIAETKRKLHRRSCRWTLVFITRDRKKESPRAEKHTLYKGDEKLLTGLIKQEKDFIEASLFHSPFITACWYAYPYTKQAPEVQDKGNLIHTRNARDPQLSIANDTAIRAEVEAKIARIRRITYLEYKIG